MVIDLSIKVSLFLFFSSVFLPHFLLSVRELSACLIGRQHFEIKLSKTLHFCERYLIEEERNAKDNDQ
jgi:hypothetical protein